MAVMVRAFAAAAPPRTSAATGAARSPPRSAAAAAASASAFAAARFHSRSCVCVAPGCALVPSSSQQAATGQPAQVQGRTGPAQGGGSSSLPPTQPATGSASHAWARRVCSAALVADWRHSATTPAPHPRHAQAAAATARGLRPARRACLPGAAWGAPAQSPAAASAPPGAAGPSARRPARAPAAGARRPATAARASPWQPAPGAAHRLESLQAASTRRQDGAAHATPAILLTAGRCARRTTAQAQLRQLAHTPPQHPSCPRRSSTPQLERRGRTATQSARLARMHGGRAPNAAGAPGTHAA